MRYKRKKGSKLIKSKKHEHNNIKFDSGLELYCYIALQKHKILGSYQGEAFQLLEPFEFENDAYERQSNSKGEFINRGKKKVLGIKYTPDFTDHDYIIETKGMANETFPIRYKLFKRWMTNMGDSRTLYKPQNQKEIDVVVQLILEKRRKTQGSNLKDES